MTTPNTTAPKWKGGQTPEHLRRSISRAPWRKQDGDQRKAATNTQGSELELFVEPSESGSSAQRRSRSRSPSRRRSSSGQGKHRNIKASKNALGDTVVQITIKNQTRRRSGHIVEPQAFKQRRTASNAGAHQAARLAMSLSQQMGPRAWKKHRAPDWWG